MVDNNKSESGIENEVLACNTLCQEEGIRALAMLKAAMAGEEVKRQKENGIQTLNLKHRTDFKDYGQNN